MTGLIAKAFIGLIGLLAIMALVLFLPAGTLDYWQAWLFIGVFGLSSLLITTFLIAKDPALLARRVQAGPTAEKQRSQQIIQSFAALGFVSLLAIPALDHRFHWSSVPVAGVIVADVLVVIGFGVVFLVYRENSFTSATIEVTQDQKVISTGPYSVVRHPMYLGALPLLLGMAPALGSWIGLTGCLLILPALVWRIFDEERYLAANLPGYKEYRARVQHRLIPYFW